MRIGQAAGRATYIVLFLFGAISCPGSAQNVRSISLSANNDGLVFWVPPHDRSDRYFTHGMELEAVVAWAPRWASFLGGGNADVCGQDLGSGSCILTRLTLGNEIYTPNFIFDSDPTAHDRPYAGWLYLEAATSIVASDRSSSLKIQVGVTGKPSMAGPIHKWFHRALNKHEPIGWEHQIPFEPAFLIRYDARRAFPAGPPEESAYFAVEPHFAATVGTLRTGASAGLSLLAGWNATSALDWQGPIQDSPYFLVKLGVDSEFVLRNLFLDGNTWDKSSPTEREIWIGRIQGRAQFGWGRYGIEFGATSTTLEFRGQDGAQTFGTIKTIVRF